MFFNLDKVVKVEVPEPKAKKGAWSCEDCALYRNCKTPQIAPFGEGRLGILIILDEVTTAQDKSGNTRQGSYYNFLREKLNDVGINIYKDCHVVNSIRCHNDKDGKHGVKTLTACSNLLYADIERLKPKVIVPTNSQAMNMLLYDREKGRASSASYYDFCGKFIPDQKFKAWVAPIYDPDWYMKDLDRQKNRKTITPFYEPYFKNHLESIKEYIGKPVETFDPFSDVKVLMNVNDAINALKEVSVWKSYTFDYETDSISPYGDSKFYAVSFGKDDVTYTMPWFDNPDFLYWIKKVLSGPAVKIAHNMQFEWVWSKVKLDIDVKIEHDSMIAMHVWNNQAKTGLKYASYVFFGVIGYDHVMEKYLKSGSKDQKAFGKQSKNTIKDADLYETALYCGADSKITYKLMRKLWFLLDKEHQMPGYELFMQGQYAFARMSYEGFRINTELMEKVIPELQAKVDAIFEKILTNDLIRYQWLGGKFNPASDHDMRKLLYQMLKLPVTERTDSGLPSVEEDVLVLYKDDVPFLIDIMDYRSYYKILNTFIEQIRRETFEGMIHPDYLLNQVQTFRSSSKSPNWQNLPSRNKEAVNYVKSLILPKKGHKLIEYDQSGLEMRGSGIISGDPRIAHYILNPGSADMHKNMACRLFFLSPDEVSKNIRQTAKTINFALLYGSYYVLTATLTWKQMNSPKATEDFGIDLLAHVKSKGIKNYEEWEQHCANIEQWFWKDEFSVLAQYRKDTHKHLIEHGYIDYVNGFRYYGPASRNAVCNAPIQGPSFHINLYTIIKITDELDKRGMESRILGQVHDSIIASVAPHEEELFDYLIWFYGTQEVRKFYKWIDLDLEIEKSATPEIDQPWSMKGKGEVLHGPLDNKFVA